MPLSSITLPAELTERPQWVLSRSKVPTTAMGYRASTTDPHTWSEYGYLIDLLRKRRDFADGLGYVFSADDPFTGLDLDSVWQSDADADEGREWAMGIIRKFSDTYTEASPSDTGLHIWCRAKLSADCAHAWLMGPDKQAIEIYDSSRFFVVTGRSNGVMTIPDHQADIERLIEHLGSGIRSASARRIPKKIPHGTQHRALVSLAGSMARRGMSIDAIEAALQITNTQQCERPGTPKAIRKIAESTLKWSNR